MHRGSSPGSTRKPEPQTCVSQLASSSVTVWGLFSATGAGQGIPVSTTELFRPQGSLSLSQRVLAGFVAEENQLSSSWQGGSQAMTTDAPRNLACQHI